MNSAPPRSTAATRNLPREEISKSERDGEPAETCARQELDNFFREQHEALVRFLMVRLHSLPEAHEVAQEAYLRILTHDKPEALSFIRARLYRTAENLAINRLMQRQRRSELERQFLSTTHPVSSSPEEALAARQDVKLIEECLRELPPICRTVFMLARLEGMSIEEIAQRLNVSRRSVLRYIARALEFCHGRLLEASEPKGRGSDESL